MEARVIHPVILAVHDVVADFHVLQDLGNAQGHRRGNEYRRYKAKRHHEPAAGFETSVQADHPPDIARVPVAEVCENLVPDRVQIGFKFCELRFGHLFHGDTPCGASRLRDKIG